MPKSSRERVWFQTYKYFEVWVGTQRDWEEARQEGIYAWGPLDPSQHQIRMKGGKWQIAAQTQEGRMEWWPVVDLVLRRREQRLKNRFFRIVESLEAELKAARASEAAAKK